MPHHELCDADRQGIRTIEHLQSTYVTTVFRTAILTVFPKNNDMTFHVHDEVGKPWARAFLDGWIPVVSAEFRQLLGQFPTDPVHVVVSGHRQHSKRFPKRKHYAASLQGEERSELGGSPVLSVGEWDSFAHGVTTIVRRTQKPPVGVPDGSTAIFLDVETISQIAADLSVSSESMLGRVTAHELSHVFRRHAQPTSGPVHTWLQEGDAQRDAWYALTQLLAHDTFCLIAREGRAAQVRLSLNQPAAYARFPIRWQERNILSAEGKVVSPRVWKVSPARHVSDLSNLLNESVEVPFVAVQMDIPIPGDQVFLADSEMVSGPWILSALTEVSLTDDEEDALVARGLMEALLTNEDHAAGGASRLRTEPVRWLQLRRPHILTGFMQDHTSKVEHWGLKPLQKSLLRPLDEGELGALNAKTIGSDLESVVEDVERVRAEGIKQFREETIKYFAEAESRREEIGGADPMASEAVAFNPEIDDKTLP